MVKPNYNFEKRQKEKARKRKKEEKRLQKLNKDDNPQKDDTQPNSEND